MYLHMVLILEFFVAVIRVTKKFNSKDYCVARSYEYLLPTYALSPTFEVSTQLCDCTIREFYSKQEKILE